MHAHGAPFTHSLTPLCVCERFCTVRLHAHTFASCWIQTQFLSRLPRLPPLPAAPMADFDEFQFSAPSFHDFQHGEEDAAGDDGYFGGVAHALGPLRGIEAC